jgi:hypothetical protein
MIQHVAIAAIAIPQYNGFDSGITPKIGNKIKATIAAMDSTPSVNQVPYIAFGE